MEELEDRLKVIEKQFLETFGGDCDDAKFVVRKLKQCLEGLKPLYCQLPTTSPTVSEQYKLLKEIEYEEQDYQKTIMDARQDVLTQK